MWRKLMYYVVNVSVLCVVAVTGSYQIRLVFKLFSTLETGFAFHFSLFRTQVPKSTSERVCEMYELVIQFIFKHFSCFDLCFFTCYVKFYFSFSYLCLRNSFL